jgi:hypothetical protein
MKRILIPLAVLGALAAAGPAAAQIVNGLNSPSDPQHEAPIATKGGGGSSSINAPGEEQAVQGALQNEREARAGHQLPETRVISRNETSQSDNSYNNGHMEGQ